MNKASKPELVATGLGWPEGPTLQKDGSLVFVESYRSQLTVFRDGKVSQLAFLSYDLFCLGHLDQARLRSEAAVDEARKLHAFSLAFALAFACTVDWATRSRGERQARVDALIAMSEEHGFPYYRAWGNFYRGSELAERYDHIGRMLTRWINYLQESDWNDRR